MSSLWVLSHLLKIQIHKIYCHSEFLLILRIIGLLKIFWFPLWGITTSMWYEQNNIHRYIGVAGINGLINFKVLVSQGLVSKSHNLFTLDSLVDPNMVVHEIIPLVQIGDTIVVVCGTFHCCHMNSFGCFKGCFLVSTESIFQFGHWLRVGVTQV